MFRKLPSESIIITISRRVFPSNPKYEEITILSSDKGILLTYGERGFNFFCSDFKSSGVTTPENMAYLCKELLDRPHERHINKTDTTYLVEIPKKDFYTLAKSVDGRELDFNLVFPDYSYLEAS